MSGNNVKAWLNQLADFIKALTWKSGLTYLGLLAAPYAIINWLLYRLGGSDLNNYVTKYQLLEYWQDIKHYISLDSVGYSMLIGIFCYLFFISLALIPNLLVFRFVNMSRGSYWQRVAGLLIPMIITAWMFAYCVHLGHVGVWLGFVIVILLMPFYLLICILESPDNLNLPKFKKVKSMAYYIFTLLVVNSYVFIIGSVYHKPIIVDSKFWGCLAIGGFLSIQSFLVVNVQWFVKSTRLWLNCISILSMGIILFSVAFPLYIISDLSKRKEDLPRQLGIGDFYISRHLDGVLKKVLLPSMCDYQKKYQKNDPSCFQYYTDKNTVRLWLVLKTNDMFAVMPTKYSNNIWVLGTKSGYRFITKINLKDNLLKES